MQTIYFDFSRAWSQQQKDGGTIKAFQGKTQKEKEPGKYDPDMIMEENIMKRSRAVRSLLFVVPQPLLLP